MVAFPKLCVHSRPGCDLNGYEVIGMGWGVPIYGADLAFRQIFSRNRVVIIIVVVDLYPFSRLGSEFFLV